MDFQKKWSFSSKDCSTNKLWTKLRRARNFSSFLYQKLLDIKRWTSRRHKLTYPWISAETMDPDLSMMASISSMTSKYASLLAYLTPTRRHGMVDTCPSGSVAETLDNQIGGQSVCKIKRCWRLTLSFRWQCLQWFLKCWVVWLIPLKCYFPWPMDVHCLTFRPTIHKQRHNFPW